MKQLDRWLTTEPEDEDEDEDEKTDPLDDWDKDGE